MKCIKTLLVAALVLGGSSVAMAQATYTDKEGNEYTFKKHAFLDLQGVLSTHLARLSLVI